MEHKNVKTMEKERRNEGAKHGKQGKYGVNEC